MKLLDIMQEAWGHKTPDSIPIEEMNRLSRKYNFAMDRAVEWDHTAEPTLDNLQAMSADREFAVYDKAGKRLGTFKDLDTFLIQVQRGRVSKGGMR